jgi:predicted lipoprotein with Yx(FWY)xxD motif
MQMKNCLAVGTVLLAGTFVTSLAAGAATTLTAQDGRTVYVFDKDANGTPSCYDACAHKWPPYLAKGRGKKMPEGWAIVKRKDGSPQWTYDGKPLYFYSGDKKKGDKTGDGVGGVWHIVTE